MTRKKPNKAQKRKLEKNSSITNTKDEIPKSGTLKSNLHIIKSVKGNDLKEIDAIFESGKKALKVKRQIESLKKERKVAEKKGHKVEERSRKYLKVHNYGNPKPVRFDQKSGLHIYTEESLGIGKGGGTEACPFDCECCF